MTCRETREAVAAAARRLAAEGLLIGTAGNVSARCGDADGLVAVTATGLVLADATADDITVVDLAGRVVDGALAPTTELPLHLDLLQRSDIGAVVHTHAPVATALSIVLDEVPVVHYQQVALGGSIPVVPFALFGSDELATSVDAALRERRAALLAHHGTVAVADSLGAAVENALLLEWICSLYWRAASLGTPRTLTDEQHRDVVALLARLDYGRPRPASPAAGAAVGDDSLRR